MEPIKIELAELLRRNDLMRCALLVNRVSDVGYDSAADEMEILAIASRAWELCRGIKRDPILKAESIQTALFTEFGLIGKSDKYKQIIDDPTRYNLSSVLKKKIASPLAATILYCILAQQLELEYEALALPSYFFLRVKDSVGDFYIDPFDSGKLLTQEEFQKKFRTLLQRNRMSSSNLYEKASNQQLVARLLQQMKHIFILKGSAVEALRSVELLTLMFPKSPELTRDRGILYCEMEYFSKAILDLKYYLKKRPKAEDVGEIKKLASMLKGYREVMN